MSTHWGEQNLHNEYTHTHTQPLYIIYIYIYNFIRLIGQQTQDYTSNTHQTHNKRST